MGGRDSRWWCVLGGWQVWTVDGRGLIYGWQVVCHGQMLSVGDAWCDLGRCQVVCSSSGGE